MKKVIITLMAAFVLLTSATNAVQAQNRARVGIKGGLNFSNLFYSDNSANTKTLAGFHAGLFARAPIGGIVSIQPELYFTTKGAEVNYNNSFVNGTARFNLNYLELPLLVVANISPLFNVHVGPYVSYLINGKVSNRGNINAFNFEENINTDDYNKLDAGFALGAGLDFGGIGLGARYNYGLTKIGREREFLGSSYTFPNARNGVVSFYLSVGIN